MTAGIWISQQCKQNFILLKGEPYSTQCKTDLPWYALDQAVERNIKQRKQFKLIFFLSISVLSQARCQFLGSHPYYHSNGSAQGRYFRLELPPPPPSATMGEDSVRREKSVWRTYISLGSAVSADDFVATSSEQFASNRYLSCYAFPAPQTHLLWPRLSSVQRIRGETKTTKQWPDNSRSPFLCSRKLFDPLLTPNEMFAVQLHRCNCVAFPRQN